MAANIENLQENIDPDDLCPICHLLIFRPVTTRCNHTLCASCMAHWADVSVIEQFSIVPLDDEVTSESPSNIEVKCPMCRTVTTSSANSRYETTIRQKYTQTYENRAKDELEEQDSDNDVFVMTIYVGNYHQYIQSSDPTSENNHEWTFFVKPHMPTIVDSVIIHLHPTFRQSTIRKSSPPYEISRLGWGVFEINAQVVLKHGYKWMSSEAQILSGTGNSALPVNWMLTFDGDGAQGKAKVKVKKVRMARTRRTAASRDM